MSRRNTRRKWYLLVPALAARSFEPDRPRGVQLDQANRFDDASRLARGRRRGETLLIGHRSDDALDKPQRQFLAAKRGRSRRQGFHRRHDGQRLRRRRQARGRKAEAARRRRGRGDFAEQVVANIQGYAAISNPMRVAAFETPATVSEQQSPRVEQPAARVRSIGEAPLDDRRDAETLVPLLEGPVGRSCAADDFVHAPSVAGRQLSLGKSLLRRPGRPRPMRLGFALHG